MTSGLSAECVLMAASMTIQLILRWKTISHELTLSGIINSFFPNEERYGTY